MKRILSIALWSVIAGAFIGPGTVTTAASAGAGFGMSLVWALVFSTIACVVLQEASARVTILSGRELGEIITMRARRGFVGTSMIALVLGAIVVGCAAYQAGNILGAVVGAARLTGLPGWMLTLAIGGGAGTLLWFGTSRIIASLFSLLVAVMGGVFLFTATSVVYAYTYLNSLPMPFGDRLKMRRALAWVNIPLGLGVAVYTGVMLGAMPSRPFWNSPVLALLFTISALSTGVALIVFARALFGRGGLTEEQREVVHKSGYVLAATDTMLIGFEILAIFLFLMFAYLTVGDVRYSIDAILPGGQLASLFWIGMVLVGLVIPGLLELYFVIPSLLYHRKYTVSRATEMAIAAAVIFGGLMLRYVVVVAGQITGPVGL
jgi:formate-dependent nitrite reductase membrane component NrfD